MKYKNIKLRREVFTSDAWKIIQWLEDNLITRYLNEQQNVCKSIKDIIYRINMPILTHLFNQNGTFFMITENDREPIGFLRLVPKQQVTEMVIVIGDKEKWGQGLGTSAIIQGLKHAFFEWRVDEVIAKINLKNERSRRVFKKVGFTKDRELQKEIQYSISIQKFLQLAS
ncbi:GNAT family N-acetyltransferase [Clostridium botulinum]|uniref:GNAT family acetyltransferase n=1 Tax=Clostridium botulinum TaxID=1491 RepID=A0A9Q1UZL4_CLOBO|nr:GNAT family protein [Clostridium botulinum]AEB75280.1 acetyltransferase, GNAT family [Clostridium botulinum BKT015925]KEI02269.1 GNAT family acetyltransferase [Clostridium botulinum D str. 16868]KEI03234.1 GNAT family acetyltransferase [Clostridium botulinum C/D str. Sp77]KLU75073.1 GNAT family acetyltransferase [Clostridium botulinum V891]KOA75046.1 GNAT family acetyltransferase [Clostridium botulinum]